MTATMPGFTAEASLEASTTQRRTGNYRSPRSTATQVLPQAMPHVRGRGGCMEGCICGTAEGCPCCPAVPVRTRRPRGRRF